MKKNQEENKRLVTKKEDLINDKRRIRKKIKDEWQKKGRINKWQKKNQEENEGWEMEGMKIL